VNRSRFRSRGAGGGAALWTPADITTFKWYDSNDADTIVPYLSGSDVSRWDDKSGNADNALQGSASLQPSYSATGLNGLPSVFVDGTETMVIGGLDVGDNYCVFMIGEFSEYQSYIRWQEVGFLRMDDTGNCRSSGNTNLATGLVDSSGTHVSSMDLKFDGTVNGAASFLDGTAVATQTWSDASSTAYGGTPGYIGSRKAVDSFSTGHYQEIVIVKNCTTDTRQKMEGYLAWKWGTESSLPIGHPYKDAAPTV